MGLTKEQEDFVIGIYSRDILQIEIDRLDKEMWGKIEQAKPDFKRVVEIKREYAILRANA